MSLKRDICQAFLQVRYHLISSSKISRKLALHLIVNFFFLCQLHLIFEKSRNNLLFIMKGTSQFKEVDKRLNNFLLSYTCCFLSQLMTVYFKFFINYFSSYAILCENVCKKYIQSNVPMWSPLFSYHLYLQFTFSCPVIEKMSCELNLKRSPVLKKHLFFVPKVTF